MCSRCTPLKDRKFLRNPNHFKKLLQSHQNPLSTFFNTISKEKAQIIVHLAAIDQLSTHSKTYGIPKLKRISLLFWSVLTFLCTVTGNLANIIANILILSHVGQKKPVLKPVDKDLITNNKAWNLADERDAAFVSPLHKQAEHFCEFLPSHETQSFPICCQAI